MKNIFLKLSMTLLTLIIISCKIPKQKLEYLQNKYFLKLSSKNLKTLRKTRNLQLTVNYDSVKIKNVLDNNNFPNEYNFFDSTGAKKKVKDQKDCGSCWSFASTSVLAYRFYKQKGIDVDLSPQNGLSCYIRDCDAGNYGIDDALHLVKNGTVTEECFPYKSGDGKTMPNCPTTCQDGSEYKKYYAQNAYTTSLLGPYDNYFYEIIEIIFDQLVNYGPVMTSIDIFEDFFNFTSDTNKCKNEVYSYDGISNYSGGHAVTIVGYGKLGNKYYWLLQNSWDTTFCDDGFIKVEMGQIGVEHITFFEPYLPNEKASKLETTLHLNSLFNNGSMEIDATTYKSYVNWTNTIEFSFKNSDCINDRTFNIQCNLVSSSILKKQNNPVCYFEQTYLYELHEGKYELINYTSLGTENVFYLTNSFDKLNFNFTGQKCPLFSRSKFPTWIIVCIVIGSFIILVILIRCFCKCCRGNDSGGLGKLLPDKFK